MPIGILLWPVALWTVAVVAFAAGRAGAQADSRAAERHSTPARGLTSSERQELILLYTNSSNQIRFLKERQWVTANYGLLIDAALIGLASQVKPFSSGWLSLLSALAVLGFAGSVWYIFSCRIGMTAHRAIVNHIASRFSDEASVAVDKAGPDRRTPDVEIVLVTTLSIALLITVALLATRL